MSSSDASFDSSWDSETAETELEYNLEVELMSNGSKQIDPSVACVASVSVQFGSKELQGDEWSE